jgi:hypothetical protein
MSLSSIIVVANSLRLTPKPSLSTPMQGSGRKVMPEPAG